MPFLSRTLRTHLSATAFAGEKGDLTYRELGERGAEVAARLREAGVREGATVALAGAKVDEGYLAALHGIWAAGACPAPLNPRWTAREEGEALKLLAPAAVLRGTGELTPGTSAPLASSKARPVARLLTSGTTGTPRVVSLTAQNLRASAEGARERLGLGPEDRWLASLSPAHVGGLALLTRASLLGSAVVSTGGFHPRAFLQAAGEGRITHASLVPTMLHRVLEALEGRRAPGGLRCVLVGGASVSRELLHRALEAGFPLALTYGLTEASSQVATAPPELVREKPGTVGPPLPGIEIRLGGEGEILVRGKTVAPGAAGKDGWLHTGDQGRMDGDGHLWVTARLGERIISGGVNVDPAEVAGVLAGLPGVDQAVVVGLPDPEWGERVAALVVPDPGQSLEMEMIRSRAAALLAPAKRPREMKVVDALPLNANGKVDRAAVRALFMRR